MKLSDCVFDRLRHEVAETRATVVSTLVAADVAVACGVADHILLALGAFGHAPEIITPCLVRGALRSNPLSYINLPRTNKLQLLGFVLKDGDFRDLDGLDLLPLADGNFVKFCCRGSSEKRYVATDEFPRDLLPTLMSLMVDIDESDDQMVFRMNKLVRDG